MRKRSSRGQRPRRPEMKRRVLGLMLTLSMLVAFMPTMASAEIVDSGTCGDNVTWVLDSDGTLTVSGIGDMYNYAYHPFETKSNIKSVIIENGVTRIGEQIFGYCNDLTSVTIPDSVTSIGNQAFWGCNSLINVTIPNSVTSIGYRTFEQCDSLTSVTIGNRVTSIGSGTFSNCRSLNSVYITDLAAYLNINFGDYDSNPMYYAKKLYLNNKRVTGEVTIPDGVTKIANYAFYGLDITSVTIPDSVTSIGKEAFRYCSDLKDVYITDLAAWCNIKFSNSYSTPMHYANNLYLNNKLVTELVIPNSVTSIGNFAFSYCGGLTSAILPNSVTTIGADAFFGCSGLTSITIPNSVVNIGDEAFCACGSLTSITIPDSVITVGNQAFYDCESLISVAIGNSVTTIGSYAFSACKGLVSVTIPDNVTSIGSSAFSRCSGLTSLAIGNGITNIGEIFGVCNNLTKIIIPKSVIEIERGAFDGCSKLKIVEYGGSKAEWEEMYIGANNDYLKNATIHYNSTLAPTPKPTPIPTTTATIIKSETDTAYTFDVTPEATYANCYVYAAVYDENNVLLGVKRVPLEMTGNTSISVDKSVNDTLAKVFIFADTLQPIITAKEFLLI